MQEAMERSARNATSVDEALRMRVQALDQDDRNRRRVVPAADRRV